MPDVNFEYQIGDMLRSEGLKLAVAESCTGGLIGHLITNAPGSSDYFMGSVASYADKVKIHIIGVRPETLEKFGAVSRETVLEMAHGARLALNADLGLSVSGIAGPGGGTTEKPIGTVWIGLSAQDMNNAWCYHWDGDRIEVKEQTAQQALKLLINYVSEL